MAGNAIAGVLLVQREHFPVTGNLGKNGRSGDGRYAAIALDHRLTAHWQRGTAIAVNQNEVRLNMQPGYRALHGQHGCVQDIQAVDFFHLGAGNTPGQRTLLNQRKQRLAARFGQLLGVVEPLNWPGRVKDYRSGNHGAAQRATPYLVDPGNQLIISWRCPVHKQLAHSLPRASSSSATASAAL